MAGNREPKVVSADPKNPRRNNKICEYLPYSGREAFKRLRTNVLIALERDERPGCKIVGVTSAQPSEGKSSVSVNLAYSLSELGKSVLLIDCDMRRPAIHEAVNTSLVPGLSDVLNGNTNLNEAVVQYKSTTDGTSFLLIPGGEIPDHPSELLNSGRFQKLLEAVTASFDYVVVDLPPVNAVIDAINVSKYVDGMLVVVREDHCPRYVLADCMDQLRFAKTNILGFVMNGCIEGAGKRYQYSNKYYVQSSK